jgi:hypothetical protein
MGAEITLATASTKSASHLAQRQPRNSPTATTVVRGIWNHGGKLPVDVAG